MMTMMPMNTKVTTTVVQEVALKPALKAKLKKQLAAYAVLQEQLKPLKQAAKKLMDEIEAEFEKAGETNTLLDGITTEQGKVKLVTSTYTKYNDLKLLTWISVAQLNEAKETKPRRPFVRVSLPGEKEDATE